ncbi:MAG: DUF2807 domain-containing protein [Candidatus Babeliaceae bacterium]|jgi:hypothetical protein
MLYFATLIIGVHAFCAINKPVIVSFAEKDTITINSSFLENKLVKEIIAKKLVVNMSSFSSLTIESVNVEELNINISGGATVHCKSGIIKAQNINISGFSKHKAENIKHETCDVNASGFSRVQVGCCENKIEAYVSGFSRLTYRYLTGTTKNIRSDNSIISGSLCKELS